MVELLQKLYKDTTPRVRWRLIRQVIWSKANIYKLGLQGHVKIIWKPISQNLSQATVGYAIPLGRTNEKLKKKLQENLNLGLGLCLTFGKFKIGLTLKVDEKERIYLYIIGESDRPLKKKTIKSILESRHW